MNSQNRGNKGRYAFCSGLESGSIRGPFCPHAVIPNIIRSENAKLIVRVAVFFPSIEVPITQI